MAKQVGGDTLAGAGLNLADGLASGKSVYQAIGATEVAGAVAGISALCACPADAVYDAANAIDPNIGKDVNAFATACTKDVCTDIGHLLSGSGSGDGGGR